LLDLKSIFYIDVCRLVYELSGFILIVYITVKMTVTGFIIELVVCL